MWLHELSIMAEATRNHHYLSSLMLAQGSLYTSLNLKQQELWHGKIRISEVASGPSSEDRQENPHNAQGVNPERDGGTLPTFTWGCCFSISKYLPPLSSCFYCGKLWGEKQQAVNPAHLHRDVENHRQTSSWVV